LDEQNSASVFFNAKSVYEIIMRLPVYSPNGSKSMPKIKFLVDVSNSIIQNSNSKWCTFCKKIGHSYVQWLWKHAFSIRVFFANLEFLHCNSESFKERFQFYIKPSSILHSL